MSNLGQRISGSPAVVKHNSHEEIMAKFDALPKNIRVALSTADYHLDPGVILSSLRDGMPVDTMMTLIRKSCNVYRERAYAERGYHG